MACYKTILSHQEVLSLKVNDATGVVLAGIGAYLYCYSQGAFVCKKQIFNNGQKVHDITWSHTNKWCVSGGKMYAVIQWINKQPEIINQLACSDWLIHVKPISEDCEVLLTAHNEAHLYNSKTGKVVAKSAPVERCILYSGTVHITSCGEVLVFAGTVFSEVIVWLTDFDSSKCPSILYHVKGHKGVIFSISVSSSFCGKAVLCTTSDDRSVRVKYCDDLKDTSSLLEDLPTMYGHTARVWKSLLFKDHFLTIGEDSLVCLWNNRGHLVHKLSIHQEAGIRSIASNQNDCIYTGGSDGAILKNTIYRFRDTSQCVESTKAPSVNSDTPRKVVFLRDGKECYLTDNTIFIGTNNEYLQFTLSSKATDLACSPCRNFIAVSLINGTVNIYDIVKGLVDTMHISKQKNRCELLLWKRNYLLVQLSGFDVIVYDTLGISDSPDKSMIYSTFKMPKRKERSCTCFEKYTASDGIERTLLGDRSGNLHVYLNDNGMLVETLEHLHSHLGMNDILYKKESDIVVTVGAGGWMRLLSPLKGKLTLLRSLRIPMESTVKILSTSLGQIIACFQSTRLKLWNPNERTIHGEVECGGGHRSFDFLVEENRIGFIFIKNKRIYKSWLNLYPMQQLRAGFHSKTINSLVLLCSEKDGPVVISGSDDTTVRVSVLGENDISSLFILQQHVSSVRVIEINREINGSVLVVTGGGREQLALTRIHLDNLMCHELLSYLPGNATAEGRFMCLKCVTRSENRTIIIGGRSDCMISIFVYEGSILEEIETLSYSHCILRIEIIHDFLLSMGTDGKCVIWDLSFILNKNREIPVKPLAQFPLHQSGINSSWLVEQPGRLLLVTGGDDNSLSISDLRFSKYSPSEWSLISQWTSHSAHSCQITGIIVVGSWLISVSIDQKMAVHRLDLSAQPISAVFVSDTMVAVSDPHGLTLLSTQDDTLTICVYGKGIEVVNINVEKLDN